MSYDFGEFIEADLSSLAEPDYGGVRIMFIGCDQNTENNFTGVLDEFIVLDGGLTDEDIHALAAYYGA